MTAKLVRRRKVLSKTCVCVMTLIIGVAAAAVERQDILFYAPMNGTTDAQISRGAKTAKTAGTAAYEQGWKGKALVCGEAGAVLSYEVKDNLDPQRGTIAMWVKAVDWEPSEKKFHVFFEAGPRPGWLLLYKYISVDSLFILVGKSGKKFQKAGAPVSKLTKGTWHHLVATWKQGETRIYIDGKGYGKKHVDVPTAIGKMFQIGDRPWGVREGGRKTLIDEVYIYRRVLEPSEIQRLYKQALTPELPRVTVVPCTQPPQIDGRIQPGEWDTAAAVTGFIGRSELSRRQTTVRLTYDKERLYLVFQSPVSTSGQLVAKANVRDSNTWDDDAIEIFLSPDHKRYFHFIGNSIGALYDACGRNAKWNGRWQYRCRIANGIWTAEVSVPFKDLGVKMPMDGQKWGMNLCRDWKKPQQWTSWSRAGNFHNVKHFGELVFRHRGPTLAVSSYGRLLTGQLNMALTVANPSREPVTAKLDVTVSSPQGKIHKTARSLALEPGQIVPVPVKFDYGSDTEADTVRVSLTNKSGKEQNYRSVISFSTAQQMQVVLGPWPSRGILMVAIDLNGLREVPKSLTVGLELIAKDTGRIVSHTTVSRFEHLQGQGELAIAKLPPGHYLVQATARDGNAKPLALVRQAFEKPPEPKWRNSRIGIVEGVLPPWTPMKTKHKDGAVTVDCWGRTYQFNKSLLPTQMTTRGAPLLAAPMTLTLGIEGKQFQLNSVLPTIAQTNGAEVILKGEQTAGPLRVNGQVRMEFDGLIVVELELTPTKATRVNQLTLEIPLHASHARYQHLSGEQQLETGAIARKDGWKSQKPFKHFLWIGDEDRGLTWFCETNDNWYLKESARALRMVRRGNVVRLTCSIIDKPVTLKRPYKLVFGLQATPVKPMPKGWRGWGINRNFTTLWTTPKTAKHFGYPEVSDPVYVKKRIDGINMPLIPYSALTTLSVNSPEFKYWGAEWGIGANVWKVPVRRLEPTPGSDVALFGWGYRDMCPANKDWQDFLVYKNLEFVTKNNFNGLYHDFAWPFPCDNPRHGCGPGRMPILACRTLYKRIYAMLKGLDKPTFMIQHANTVFCTPVLSFCDGFVTGEQIKIGKKNDEADYLDLITLDWFKTVGTGRQWGVVPMWLSMFNKKQVMMPANTERMMAIMLLHDASTIWTTARCGLVIKKIWQALDDFGLEADDVDFIGYWATDNMIVTDSADTLVSLYRRSGKTLVVVANMSKQDRSVSVRLDLKKLGLSSGAVKATDLLSGKPCKFINGSLWLDVAWRNFRLIELKNTD